MAPLLTFYGDDFTGASAVMEVLSFAGLRTMLFLNPPSKADLAKYPGLQAVGVAGVARSQNPDWMRANLPPVYRALDQLGAPVLHYKVCSTFDSSPEIGSIGVAAEIGRSIRPSDWNPLVVGAPAMGRFQAFGNLFAAAGTGVFRLDRHPVMARHPVTPMAEADLGRHLSKQTDLPVGMVTLADMKTGQADAALTQARADGASIVALDAVDEETLAEAGRLIWQDGETPVFALGSQGVEYALVAYWQQTGMLPNDLVPAPFAPVDQLFAVSASVAATTADQIACAVASGFHFIQFDATAAVDLGRLDAEFDRVRRASLSALSEGRDVLVATARGPDDPAVAAMSEAITTSGQAAGAVNDQLGAALGRLVSDIRTKTGLPRIAIAGGDTSGHALTALGAEALSAVAPLAPGGPLCRVHASTSPVIDGLQVALKGG